MKHRWKKDLGVNVHMGTSESINDSIYIPKFEKDCDFNYFMKLVKTVTLIIS